jgi:hypothetical protein
VSNKQPPETTGKVGDQLRKYVCMGKQGRRVDTDTRETLIKGYRRMQKVLSEDDLSC